MIQNNISTRTQYLPKTVIELENWIKESCFNFNNYSISGNKIGSDLHFTIRDENLELQLPSVTGYKIQIFEKN